MWTPCFDGSCKTTVRYIYCGSSLYLKSIYLYFYPECRNCTTGSIHLHELATAEVCKFLFNTMNPFFIVTIDHLCSSPNCHVLSGPVIADRTCALFYVTRKSSVHTNANLWNLTRIYQKANIDGGLWGLGLDPTKLFVET